MSSSLMLNMCRVMDNKMHCRRISTVWKRSRFNIMKATIKKSSHHSRPTTIIISTSSHSITTARHKCNRIAAIALHLLNNITRVPCRSSSSNITTPCHKLQMHQLLIMCLNIIIRITITISQTTIMRISMVLVLKGSMTSAPITRTAILKIDRAMLMTTTRSLEEHHRISRITTFIPMLRSTLRCRSLMHMSSNNSIHTILQP